MKKDIKKIEYCSKCLLPSSYPGIHIENGVCNFCKQYKKSDVEYLGEERLKKDIADILAKYPDRNPDYDVAVGFSGGMDSTWLLYYATKILNLRVLAVTMRHKYLPEHTEENISNIAKLLDVPVVYFDNPFLNEGAEHYVRAWAKHPTARGLISFCTGCRYGLSRLLYQAVADRNIHILFSGLNQYENTEYREKLVMLNPDRPNKLGFVLGYGKELLENPRYLASPYEMAFQMREYKYARDFSKMRTNSKLNRPLEGERYLDVTELYPFYNYIHWNRDEANAVLKKLGWKKGSGDKQAWRTDCEVGLIRQYYYRRLLGYNDMEVKRANLLRSQQVTLENAGSIQETDDTVIRSILKDSFGLDYDEIERRIQRKERKKA